jgi:hypothetical protein
MTSHPEAIDDFWRWFASVSAALVADPDDPRLLAELDEGCEVGPGSARTAALVLSPAGDRALLALTRAIVAAAPALPDWELHPARPPRPWDLHFEVADAVSGEEVAIDAGRWRYAVVEQAGERRLLLEAAELASWPVDEQRAAAEIVLDTLLGEARRLEAAASIGVAARLPPEVAAAARPLATIARDLGPTAATP